MWLQNVRGVIAYRVYLKSTFVQGWTFVKLKYYMSEDFDEEVNNDNNPPNHCYDEESPLF